MLVHGYSTLRNELPMPGATGHRLVTPAGLRNDELTHHLAEIRDSIDSDSEPEACRDGLLDHLNHVNWHYVAAAPDNDLRPYLQWARDAQGIIRIDDDLLLDPQGHPLVAEGPAPGRVPVHPQSLARAERVRRELAAHHLEVPTGALPVRSTHEVRIRRADLVGRRAVALVVAADFALSVLEGQPLDWRVMQRVFPLSFGDRSPTELQLFADEDDALARQLKWGYEAAAQLLAMCGRVDVGFPTDFADQGQVWNASVGVEERGLLPSLSLLPADDICDEWERARALHFAVASARSRGLPAPAHLDPEIVAQRYRAMEWLMTDQEWDDVRVAVPSWVG